MRINNHRLIALLLTTLFSVAFSDIKIARNDDFKLTLGVDAAFNGEIEYDEVAAGFVIDAAKISLTSTYQDKLKLFLSVDPSKPNSSSKSGHSEPLDKLYLQWYATERMRIRAGQFKVPFGLEQFEGLQERPLITHRKSTKEIAPGLDRGVMISGKKISGWFSYYTGFFNGTSVEQSLNSVTLLVPVKLQLDRDLGTTSLKVGVNSYLRVNYPYNMNLKYRWGNGLYSELKLKTGRNNELTFLGEFLEKLDFRDLKTSQKAWELGGFLISSYRSGNVEPVLFLERYNRDVTLEDSGDKLLIGGGLNIHFLEDKFRFSTQIEYESLLFEEGNTIVAIASIRGFL